MDIKAFPYIFLLGSLWGSNLVVSRFGIGQFDPLLFAGLRLTLSILGFVVIFAVSQRQRWPRDPLLWRKAAVVGVIGTAVPMSFMLTALQYQSSGVTSLLITIAPAILVILAHFFLPDEALNRNKALGVALALSGAFLIILRGESGLPNVERANPIGYALVLIAVTAESINAIYIRKQMQGFDSLQVTSVRLLVAGLIVLPLALAWRGFDVSQVNLVGVGALTYATFIGALLPLLLAFYLTRQFGATAFSLAAYVIPVVAAVVGYLLLGEIITEGMVAGMVLIALGITLINRYS